MFRQREIFNILVSERSLRHREFHSKGNIKREFYIGDIMEVSNKLNSIINNRVDNKSVFKTKGHYRDLEKATPISYFLQSLHVCEGLGRPKIKLK